MPDRTGTRAAWPWQGLPGWIADAAGMFGLALVALALGYLVNVLRAEPLPWVYAGRAKTLDAVVSSLKGGQSVQPTTPPQEVRLDEFQGFVLERKGLVLDARGKVFYARAHVPGAVSLPREEFATEYPRLREKLDAHKDQPVVVYCSGADCPDAQLLADALGKLGYSHLLIYTSGWEEWSQTGLPQEGSEAPP